MDLIGKFIKQSHYDKYLQGDAENAQLVTHLRDFLYYLEEKNLINQQQLEDKDQLQQLV